MPNAANESMKALESRIRSEGWHPDSLSDDAFLQLMLPFESLHMDPEDRIGLKLEFALHRYTVRYLRGHLGESAPTQLFLLRLTGRFVLATDPHIHAKSDESLLRWFYQWHRGVLEPAERRLDILMYGGKTLVQLTEEEVEACEPAVTHCLLGMAGELMPDDGDQTVNNLRSGYALHTAGVATTSALTPSHRKDAELAVPADDISAASYQRFLSEEHLGGPSLLRVTDKGVFPDVLRVKSRLDSLGCRPTPKSQGPVDPEQVMERTDPSAETAAEVYRQVREVQAVLTQIRDREQPGSSRRIVAESLLAQEGLPLRELARRHGKAFEGIRRAHDAIKEEISRLM